MIAINLEIQPRLIKETAWNLTSQVIVLQETERQQTQGIRIVPCKSSIIVEEDTYVIN